MLNLRLEYFSFQGQELVKLRLGTFPKLLHVITFLEMCKEIFMRHCVARRMFYFYWSPKML